MINFSNKNTLIILASFLVVLSVILVVSQQGSTKVSYVKEIEKLQAQSTSDDVNAIEKDLLDTDLDSLDSELLQIEDELELDY